jgi:hypothetical protein
VFHLVLQQLTSLTIDAVCHHSSVFDVLDCVLCVDVVFIVIGQLILSQLALPCEVASFCLPDLKWHL